MNLFLKKFFGTYSLHLSFIGLPIESDCWCGCLFKIAILKKNTTMYPFFQQLQGKIPSKIQYKFEFWFLCSYLENGVTRVPRASGILFFGARNIIIEISQPCYKISLQMYFHFVYHSLTHSSKRI